MKNLPIDWDSVPDVMNKDQFYRLCHISKSTALHLLKSGKVPFEWTGKKTRCYKIKKEDIFPLRPLKVGCVYPYEIEKIIGKRVNRDILTDECLLWEMLQDD